MGFGVARFDKQAMPEPQNVGRVTIELPRFFYVYKPTFFNQPSLGVAWYVLRVSMEKQVRDNLGYHYTSIDSFMSIFDGIEDGKFKFHASSIFSLNDPTEMEYGYREICKLLPEIEKELSISDVRYKLSGMWSIDPQLSLNEWINRHLKMMRCNFQHSCVISYSRNRDNLQLWGMYGNNGKGVALGLDVRNYYIERISSDGQKIYDWTHMELGFPHAVDVEYSTISSRSIPYLYTKMEYSRYWQSIQHITEKDKIIDEQINALTQMMIIVAPFVKHSVYGYEKESRIIQVHKKILDIKFKKNARESITPYIEVEIPTSCLKEVIVGPCCDFDLMKKCIEIMLLQKGIKDVEIVPSSVPYRS